MENKESIKLRESEKAEPEQQRKCFTMKLDKNQAYLEILVLYSKNPSEEAVFESNRIKEQHDTMKLQNEEVMLKTLLKP